MFRSLLSIPRRRNRNTSMPTWLLIKAWAHPLKGLSEYCIHPNTRKKESFSCYIYTCWAAVKDTGVHGQRLMEEKAGKVQSVLQLQLPKQKAEGAQKEHMEQSPLERDDRRHSKAGPMFSFTRKCFILPRKSLQRRLLTLEEMQMLVFFSPVWDMHWISCAPTSLVLNTKLQPSGGGGQGERSYHYFLQASVWFLDLPQVPINKTYIHSNKQ